MNINRLLSRPTTVALQTLNNIPKCCYSSTKSDVVKELEVEEVPSYDVEPRFTEEELDRIRNKSKLSSKHRNILNDKKPYDQSYELFHDKVWYRKKILGRYGIEAAGINPGICWPSLEDIEDQKEYESLAYPISIQEQWKQIEQKKKEEAEAIRKREEEIDKVVANFGKWKDVLQAKIEKKEAELRAAKERREKALQEIREQFGFNIDPRDERFKEIMAKKEKEDKKKKKEEKKRLKAEKAMAMLLQADNALKETEGKVAAKEGVEKDTENKAKSEENESKGPKNSKKAN